ncbi:hypothetical protein Gferi_20380 [Geosporobacter ferrireducens]|uniref:Uncharacterized protein n=1 Tax=Geosporobacter ferrireducens TaxID=1424294 RepID=A0A1D8GLA5_9FIRM|nr:hypothetical protein Gferi_20380 [Geosporobacter ferrireducens]MTI55457.1 hypothetical protein [Geosporobacter ferrireducens]
MLGEAPIEINAAAQKCRETPMRLTDIIEKVIFNAADFERSKLSSAKAQHRRIIDSLYCWVEIFLYFKSMCKDGDGYGFESFAQAEGSKN